jgi:FkbM family methyltransferase
MRTPQWVRSVVDPLTERIPVPIVSGENAGKWWTLASAGSGYASGRRAAKQMGILAVLMRAGDVVWDVGAHHGYVTLMASRRVGAEGSVHAFEPSASNRRILERHLRLNGCTNATTHACALGASSGESKFGGGDTSKMRSLGQGDETVTVRRADGMVTDKSCNTPSFLKVDVEGAEADFLEGCGTLLPTHARMVIAMHNKAADRRCTDWLSARGFVLIPSTALEQARATEWRGDPDLYAVGPNGDAQTVRREIRRLGDIA